MTTNNTCKKCGCQDSFMPSPAPCPTPVGCPTPQPCSEIFDAQCVVYTGLPLSCTAGVQTFNASPNPNPAPTGPIVNTNDTIAEALEGIVDYICAETVVSLDIECDTDIVVEQGTTVTDALVNIVDYFCNNSSGNCNSLEWNNINLNNGWTTNGPSYFDFQYQTPQYAINSCTNQVYLRGTFFILEGDPDPNIPDAFTLPVGFRPSNVRWYPNQTMPASGFDNFGGSTFIVVLPDGRVIPSEVAGTNANATLFYCLDGIVFETN